MAAIIHRPTLVQICQGTIGKVVEDNARPGGESAIATSLAPYGVVLDTTTPSGTESGALRNVKVGVRGNLPPGLSVMTFPNRPRHWIFDTSPNGYKSFYEFHVQGYWSDHPERQLSADEHLLTLVLYDLSEALVSVLGPANLCGAGSAWDVTGNGDYLVNPKIEITTPAAWGEDSLALRHQIVPYFDLILTGEKFYTDPVEV